MRVYHPPPGWLLDMALEAGLRVLVDVPWDKHRCFLEDWDAMERARDRVRCTAVEAGRHPGTFAISVANEIPCDVVRYQGTARVEGFLDELIRIVKQEAPGCLATYCSFPTTEFVQPTSSDFVCFNVYLHDEERLGAYLDRLQHMAGDRPLVLSEHGVDSLGEGEEEQARIVGEQLACVREHGLAGSFVFAFTDEWFSGGKLVEDWTFGLTRADRTEKPAARAVWETWSGTTAVSTRDELPEISVVVCTYNGQKTLRACLASLERLDYPRFQVIVVDDGSLDATPRIAAAFPDFRYVRLEHNMGLSAARNAGAHEARGSIVAYTDDDCEVHPDWLRHLASAMEAQDVEAMGGPSVTPVSDGWMARCVAESPGNPGHVMLDDRNAEHVPGCNLAVRREVLLDVGGFDPRFRQAGDDVDFCWRLLDAGYRIGYAPGAMVWHHRRATLKAFLGQQRGYGRAEAHVFLKHPARFSALGRSHWGGVIYGAGATGLQAPGVVYHGRFGSAGFQIIYRSKHVSPWAVALSLEWHASAVFFLLLATIHPPLAACSAGLWITSLGVGFTSARPARLPAGAPRWCRPVIVALHVLQPLLRGWHRQAELWRLLDRPPGFDRTPARPVRTVRIDRFRRDLYWDGPGPGRDELLRELVAVTREHGGVETTVSEWSSSDLEFLGDRWHGLLVRTVTEELKEGRRFTRARTEVFPTLLTRVLATAVLSWCFVALLVLEIWALVLGAIGVLLGWTLLSRSRERCLRGMQALLSLAGERARLQPVGTAAGSPAPARAGRPSLKLEEPAVSG